MREIDPALLQHASALCDTGEPAKVEQSYNLCKELFRQNPESPHLANIIAHCYSKIDRFETAYYIYRYIQKFPNYDGPMLWNNIGHCLAEKEHWKEASTFFHKALNKNPDDHVALANLSSIYCKSGDPVKAVEYSKKSLSINPTSKEAKWNGALALLKLQQWKEGWEWYDELLGRKWRPLPPKIDGAQLPTWNGESGAVLIQGEQGLGDEIMFSSMIPDVQKKARVVLLCDPRLTGLFERSFPGCVAASRKSKEIAVPKQIDFTHGFNIGSLGRMFRNADDDFPGEPYLKADPVRMVMFKGLLDSLGPKKKIGLMWKGGVGGLDEFERSITLHDLEPLLSDEFEWISLNHLPSAKAETERFYESTGIKIHHWDFIHGGDYDDTAALVSVLDCVVATTCTVAHCAGGLGVPVRVLVPRMPQWRYGADGDSIPWYKSMKLYRQTDKWPLEEVLAGLR